MCVCTYALCMGAHFYARGVCKTYTVCTLRNGLESTKNEAHPLSQNNMICLYLTVFDSSLQISFPFDFYFLHTRKENGRRR